MPKYEYIGAILEYLLKKGPSSKYAISKGTAIPYSTVLRKLPEMDAAYIIQQVAEGKRGAEIYMINSHLATRRMVSRNRERRTQATLVLGGELSNPATPDRGFRQHAQENERTGDEIERTG